MATYAIFHTCDGSFFLRCCFGTRTPDSFPSSPHGAVFQKHDDPHGVSAGDLCHLYPRVEVEADNAARCQFCIIGLGVLLDIRISLPYMPRPRRSRTVRLPVSLPRPACKPLRQALCTQGRQSGEWTQRLRKFGRPLV